MGNSQKKMFGLFSHKSAVKTFAYQFIKSYGRSEEMKKTPNNNELGWKWKMISKHIMIVIKIKHKKEQHSNNKKNSALVNVIDINLSSVVLLRVFFFKYKITLLFVDDDVRWKNWGNEVSKIQ